MAGGRATEAAPGGEIAMRVRIPDGWGTPERVVVHDLHAGERELTVTCAAGEAAFTVPAPEWYAVVALEF